ncbi:MAG: imelysin [Prevotella sp.]|nr:imelysin [Prevotella sp.]
MKKIFKYAMMFAAACALSLGVTACGDDDDDNPDNKKTAEQQKLESMKAITQKYLDDVVYPTYTNLANQSQVLYDLINGLKTQLKAGTKVKQSDIDAICTAYKKARAYWEESEAFLYGAASDFDIDPHIDTWPLELDVLAEDLKDNAKIANLDGANGIEWARTEGNLTPENLGFHGIEFIFFRNGKNRDVAIFNNDAVEDDSNFAGLDVSGKEEVIFAAAVAGDLRDKCFQLEVSWLGNKAQADHIARINACKQQNVEEFKTTVEKNGLSYGEDMLAAGQSNSTMKSWRTVMETILVSGCSNICGEVADQKMGQAYRATTSGGTSTHIGEDGKPEEDDANYIESPYSYNSFTDFKGNILSIQYSLYGAAGATSAQKNSIMDYLKTYAPEKANTLDNKLKEAIAALDACLNSGKAFVQAPGAVVVKEAMDAIGDLDDCINETANWILMN